jgi:hypothetical protein
MRFFPHIVREVSIVTFGFVDYPVHRRTKGNRRQPEPVLDVFQEQVASGPFPR